MKLKRAQDPFCPTCKTKLGRESGEYDSLEGFRQTVFGVAGPGVILVACPHCGTVLGAIEDRERRDS